MARARFGFVLAIALWLAATTGHAGIALPLTQPSWAELTPEQQRVLTPLAGEWDKMETYRRKKWLGIAQRYQSLSPEEQARMQRRMTDWVKLTPEERKRAREKYKSLQKAPPEQKQAVRQKWQEYKELPEAEKARLKAVANNQEKVGTAAVTFIVLGDLRGYERLPEVLKPSIDSGHTSPERADATVAAAASTYGTNAQFARDEAIRGASLGAMTLMLAAEAKGLVSGPMGGFDRVALAREFNIPERYVPVMLIAVGYAAPGNYPRKPRLSADRVLSFENGDGLLA